MRHFAASVEDLNAWQNTPRTAVILENKETAYAITGDHPGVVVLHGHGFSVVNYGRIAWIRRAQDVIYWGDLDLPGLQFVSDLRGLGIPARTILTDIATLDPTGIWPSPALPSAPPELPHLTPASRNCTPAWPPTRPPPAQGCCSSRNASPGTMPTSTLLRPSGRLTGRPRRHRPHDRVGGHVHETATDQVPGQPINWAIK